MAVTAPESGRRGVAECPGEEPRRPDDGMRGLVMETTAPRGRRAATALRVALAVASLAGAGAAAAQEAAPDAAGWYSAAQAASGQQLFNNYCAECHRPDLTGADGPALKGAAFLKVFGGQPLSDLYGVEHTTMPAVNPGSLPASTLLPITAFILQQNGLAAGDAPLDQASLGRTLPAAP